MLTAARLRDLRKERADTLTLAAAPSLIPPSPMGGN